MEEHGKTSNPSAAPAGLRRVIVRRTEPLSPTVRALRLACVDGQPLHYLPGQWIHLHVALPSGTDKRAYSIASAPSLEHPDEFEVAVTAVPDGSVSLALHGMHVGDELEFDGPYGFFTREDAAGEPALFVATGTGVCPLRAMLEAELNRLQGPALCLLLGCRTEEDILYRQQFESLAQLHPRFGFRVTLSRPGVGWRGMTGYVQTQLPSVIDREHKPHVYVCGLSDMVNEVRRTLKQTLGYDRRMIHSERYD